MSFIASDNQAQLLVFTYNLVSKPSKTVTIDRRRGESKLLAPKNQLLRVDGTRQPGKVIHLDGKLQLQTHNALWEPQEGQRQFSSGAPEAV